MQSAYDKLELGQRFRKKKEIHSVCKDTMFVPKLVNCMLQSVWNLWIRYKNVTKVEKLKNGVIALGVGW